MSDRNDALGVAVIGAGYWGPNLIRNFGRYEGTDLRWVCDLDLDRADQVVSGTGVDTTRDVEEVLGDPAVDAVAIATPAATHLDLALAALDAGKHVLIEKPLAASATEGQKLVAAARASGLVLMCDHTYCYTPAVERIRDIIHSGELGDIQFIDSVRINLGLVQPDVNVLWDLAPHDLSILDYILPEEARPQSVAAQGADPIGAGVACVGYLTLPLANRAIAHAHVNWLSPTKIRTTVIGGSKRTIVWDDLNPSQRLSVYDRGIDIESIGADSTREAAMVSYRLGDMTAPALGEKEALLSVVGEFDAAIREGRPARTDGSSGLRVLDILEAASRSMELGGAMIGLAGMERKDQS